MTRGWRPVWFLCAALVLPVWLQPSDAKTVQPAAQAEARILVAGRVTIEFDGTVSDWTIDHREQLPEAVTRVIDAAVPAWRFEPIMIDGKPARGSARMSLLVVAERIDGIEEERYRILIRDGHFGRDATHTLAQAEGRHVPRDAPPDDRVSAINMRPPLYAGQALSAGVEGTVYLVVRVGRSGRVEEAAVEQVNLLAVGTERTMAYMRDALAAPTLVAARRWTFRPPTRGESVDDESWTLRIPVDFRLGGGEPRREYGKWEVYVPGPRNPVPWLPAEAEDAERRPDALVAGEVYQLGMGLKLLSPLGGG